MRQGAAKKPLSAPKPNQAGIERLIILNDPGLSNEGGSLAHRCIMRSFPPLLACLFLTATTAAQAETRVFIIANEGDGYVLPPRRFRRNYRRGA